MTDTISFEGQVVHKRSVSKRICFFDIISDVRRTCVLKSWICGEEEMARAVRSRDKIHVGDRIRFSGKVEENNPLSLEVVSFSILQRFSDYSNHTFVPIPPCIKQPESETHSSLCKFWLNTGRCPRADECKFAHPDKNSKDFKDQRAKYVSEKLETRAQLQSPTKDHDLVSRHQRASIFAEWLLKRFPDILDDSESVVLDIAGGRGDLAFELKCKRKVSASLVIVDPREQKLKNWQHRMMKRNQDSCLPDHVQCLFSMEFFHQFDRASKVRMIIGLHPDEATEPLVDIALARSIAFAVVPCCVFAQDFPHRKLKSGQEPRTYDEFVLYLQEKNEDIQIGDRLGFRGRDRVLHWRPTGIQ